MPDKLEIITAEQASRWAVSTLTADLEFWACSVARDGQVALAELLTILGTVRGSAEEPRGTRPADRAEGARAAAG